MCHPGLCAISRRIRHRVLSETKLGWKRSSVNCVYTKEISVILNKHNHVCRGMHKHTRHVQTRVTEAFKLYKGHNMFFFMKMASEHLE